MNASDPNLDALIKAAARDLLDEDLELFHSIDTSKTKMSERAIKRIRRKIRNYDRESWWSSVPLACRRAVAAVLVICSISFGFCMSVTAVRAEIVNTVMKWYDEFVAVFFVTEKTPPSVIEEYREPMLQLAGTERQVVVQTDKQYQIVYTKGSDILLSYQQMKLTDSAINIDNEKCKIEEIEIKGNQGQLFLYEDMRVALTWHDNEYKYLIATFTSDISQELIISMAESIK